MVEGEWTLSDWGQWGHNGYIDVTRNEEYIRATGMTDASFFYSISIFISLLWKSFEIELCMTVLS